jgi:hypothetical protein
MYNERLNLYKELENKLNSKLLIYITSDRQGFETQIAPDVIDLFINQLDKIGIVEKISLYLYTRGGHTATAWNIINLILQYCDKLQVIIPHKAHSAGTLISIGANSIIMTKQATLGPFDPNINTPRNPQIPGALPQNTCPVSVEAVKGYIAFAKEELAIKDDNALSDIMVKLSDVVHPLVLGEVYRSRAQIKMLAEKLLLNQVTDPTKIQQIITFLCSDSGSHDYTINRREAKNALGLNVEKPDWDMYKVIKDIYDNISEELGLRLPLDLRGLSQINTGEYSIKRALIESISGGSNYFLTQGNVSVVDVPIQDFQGNPVFQHGIPVIQQSIKEERIFEGWKYDEPIVDSISGTGS